MFLRGLPIFWKANSAAATAKKAHDVWWQACQDLRTLEARAGVSAALEELKYKSYDATSRHRAIILGIADKSIRQELVRKYREVERLFRKEQEAEGRKLNVELSQARSSAPTIAPRGAALVCGGVEYLAYREFGVEGAMVCLAALVPLVLHEVVREVHGAEARKETRVKELEHQLEEHNNFYLKLSEDEPEFSATDENT